MDPATLATPLQDWTDLLAALGSIILIDLVLAGDNALVIALAARHLPPTLQRRAIIWGTVGAIAVRSALTLAVVALLQWPGLRLVGGLLLLVIAWRLLQPDAGHGSDAHGAAATSTGFWGAMRTIVVADALMGLDNVLGVAGAAQGHFGLVIAGLLISVPIMVWGSTLVLRAVERFPVIVYLGAGVLAATAATMIRAEPVLGPWWTEYPALHLLPWACVPALIIGALWQHHRRLDSRIRARLDAWKSARPTPPADDPLPTPRGVATMLSVLVPVDGSDNALRAVRHALEAYRQDHRLRLHLLNVQPRLPRHISRFFGRRDLAAFHGDRADQALAGARQVLDGAGVPYELHRKTGDRAEAITATARELGVDHIVMGTARKNSLTRMIEDSVTNRVLELTPVPVEVVPGRAVSSLERWGLPTALGTGVGLLWLAAVD